MRVRGKMPRIGNWACGEIAFAVAAVAWVLLLHGAVPYFMTPTLAQAVWATGFAKSFANGPLLNIYAHDFGLPNSAAIAFGLAGAWPASLLIRLGLHPADSYAGMAAFWLLLAFYSAYRISRSCGIGRSLSILSALTWMSMPIIWAHAGYSMLSLGIALLPYYFLQALKLSQPGRTAAAVIWAGLQYFLATFFSVFMDGYTFVMFAIGSSILFCYVFFIKPSERRHILSIVLPVHIGCFALAYLAYITYIGKNSFDNVSVDFFRGWGLDLSFAFIPTKGIFWLLDAAGFSLKRTNEEYFGDGSVWETTFSLPIVVAGLLAWWQIRRRRVLATGFMLIALFGFFMALGPSLKIDSTKPADLQTSSPGELSALMPAEFAIGPTGSAWLSENLPGFSSMRASYRWSALGVFALWAVVVIWSGSSRTSVTVSAVTFLLITALNVPPLPGRYRALLNNRLQFNQIDQDLQERFLRNIRLGEVVAFAPWGNDFIANYLAPSVGFRTFNIGGDKNLLDAFSNWPLAMRALGDDLDTEDTDDISEMLLDNHAGAVVVPYFHMLWSPHLWPCAGWTTVGLSEEAQSAFERIPGFSCPDKRRSELRPVIQELKSLPYLDVSDNKFFATIRMRSEFIGESSRVALLNAVLGHVHFPIEFGASLKKSSFILKDGWYSVEKELVWSRSAAKLVLPVPSGCDERKCLAVLHFRAFGASAERPVSVSFSTGSTGESWNETIISTTAEDDEISVPLNEKRGYEEISIVVPDATSPREIAGSADGRTLGIALLRAELR